MDDQKWDKNHFKDILSKQQSSIKAKIESRQSSLNRVGIFDYQNGTISTNGPINIIPVNRGKPPMVQ
jgi:hypothetical protein